MKKKYVKNNVWNYKLKYLETKAAKLCLEASLQPIIILLALSKIIKYAPLIKNIISVSKASRKAL